MLQLSSRDLALAAARIFREKAAEDICVIELPKGQREFDVVVIGTGRSDRQIHAMVDEVYHFCKRHDIVHFPTEGSSGWHLLDCFDVIVHAFLRETREHYALDRLYAKYAPLDFVPLLAALPDWDYEHNQTRAAKESAAEAYRIEHALGDDDEPAAEADEDDEDLDDVPDEADLPE